MFERYSESARRALFFARYAVTQFGGDTIEPEHVVLGVLKGTPQAVARFTRSSGGVEALQQFLERTFSGGERAPDRAEIPFSQDTIRVLEQTVVEADALNNHWIRPEHILVSVMVKTDGGATRALRDAGVDLNAVRDYLRVTAGDKDKDDDEPGAHSPPRVARQWKGIVKPGEGPAYIAHLRRETLPQLRRTAGFAYATIMHRDVEDGIEFVVTTYWHSIGAIKAFAGEDVTRAVVPPAARALMVRYDDRAVHYDIVQ